MAILKLGDKHQSQFEISLTPQRHYVSSSSGITGSIYVFPNRSETQKDNIDERLNLAPMALEGDAFEGTPIVPYDSNSLEQRRIEIYQGNFSKLVAGTFIDATQYQYLPNLPAPHMLPGTYDPSTYNSSTFNIKDPRTWPYKTTGDFAADNPGSPGAVFGDFSTDAGTWWSTKNAANWGALGNYFSSGCFGQWAYVSRPIDMGFDTNQIFFSNDMDAQGIYPKGILTADQLNQVATDEWNHTPIQDLIYQHNSDIFEVVDYTSNRCYKFKTDSNLNALVEYRWTSEDVWVKDDLIFHSLPADDFDRDSQNYEVPLALLMDGADPMTQDHAWRHGTNPSDASTYPSGITVSNDSGTSSSGNGALSGFHVYYDELDIPYQDGTISKVSEVNAWPPEIAKWNSVINANYSLMGYSDLSMHPRNKTKKLIKIEKATEDHFSPGTLKQKIIARRKKSSNPVTGGWYINNQFSFCSNQYSMGNTTGVCSASTGGHNTDKDACELAGHTWTRDTTTVSPYLLYGHRTIGTSTDTYCIDSLSSSSYHNPAFTFECWIKPCEEQSTEGCIVHVPGNYAVTISPDSTFINGKPNKFKINFFWNPQTEASGSGKGAITNNKKHFHTGTNSRIYTSKSYLNVNQWHHVVVRYSPNFNSGKFEVLLDGKILLNTLAGGNDGGEPAGNGSVARQGMVYRTSDDIRACSYNKLAVGAWVKSSEADLNGVYSSAEKKAKHSGTLKTAVEEFAIAESPLYCEVNEIRMWKSIRSEYELSQSSHLGLLGTQANSKDMRYYIPFYYSPLQKKNINSDTGQYDYYERWAFWAFTPTEEDNSDTKEKFYSNESFSNFSIHATRGKKVASKVPFDENAGYNLGIPLVSTHSHLTDFVDGNIGYVAGIPNFYDSTNTNEHVFPPTMMDTDQGNREVLFDDGGQDGGWGYYLKNAWKTWDWLYSLNSLILPSDNDKFGQRTSIVDSSQGNWFGSTEYISLIGHTVGDLTDIWSIGGFYDDEKYAIQDTDFGNDLSSMDLSGFATADILASEVGGNLDVSNIESYYTDPLGGAGAGFEDWDFLPPFSSIVSIPQIYYGNQIYPGSIIMSGQINKFEKTITIKDQAGILYRTNSTGTKLLAKVGEVDYWTGTICIYSPYLAMLTLIDIDIQFKGLKNLHVLQLDIPCSTGIANTSQKKSYKSLLPSTNSNESEGGFTYISTINLHDENLNVVGKINLAQPIAKREADSIIFRAKLDF